jgi:hypothetical protein
MLVSIGDYIQEEEKMHIAKKGDYPYVRRKPSPRPPNP